MRQVILLILFWMLGIVAFWYEPSLAVKAQDNKTVLLTVFTLAVVGPVTWAYGRLSAFDKLDHIRQDQREKITAFAQRARFVLIHHGYLAALYMVMFSLVVMFLVDAFESLRPALNFLFPTIVAYFIWRIHEIFRTLMAIEANRILAADFQRKAESRRKLIDELKKEAQAQPLVSDAHLARYKQVNPNS